MGTSRDGLIDEIYKETIKKNYYRRKYKKYKEAYYILMEYWDSFPDEEKPKIDKRLDALGL